MFLKSLIACTAFHEVASWFPSQKVKYAANLRTCIVFQLYFLWRAGSLLYATLPSLLNLSTLPTLPSLLNFLTLPSPLNELTTRQLQNETMDNLNALAGYFVYDLCFLLQTTPFSGFVLHHVLGLGMIRYLQNMGVPPPHLLTMYNTLSFVAEVTNPMLNFRHFVKGTRCESLVRQINFWMYTGFRIILFPILSFQLHGALRSIPLLLPFLTIYVMSLMWYRQLIRMTWSSRALEH